MFPPAVSIPVSIHTTKKPNLTISYTRLKKNAHPQSGVTVALGCVVQVCSRFGVSSRSSGLANFAQEMWAPVKKEEAEKTMSWQTVSSTKKRRYSDISEDSDSCDSSDNDHVIEEVARNVRQRSFKSEKSFIMSFLSSSEDDEDDEEDEEDEGEGKVEVEVEEVESPKKQEGGLDRFDIQRKLQDSLQGSVYLAIDKNTDEEVALKLSKTCLVDKGVNRCGRAIAEDFRTEVELHSKLSKMGSSGSEHIVKLIEHGEDEEHIFAALEFCSQGELFDYMGQRNLKRLGVGAKATMLKLAKGVEFLHKNRVAHRDMSLENVLVDARGNPKICDFGLACQMEDGDDCISDKVFRGKLAYASPQLFYRQAYNPFANDVWCLGIMFFRLAFAMDLWESTARGFQRLQRGATVKELFLAKLPKANTDFVDLICGMLVCTEKDRFTIEDVLEHRFFK